MAQFNFYLKDPAADKPTPIMLFVSWNNTRLKLYINESIHPEYWQGKDKAKSDYQRATQTRKFKENDELNCRLDAVLSNAKTALRKFVNDNERQPLAEELKTVLNEKINHVAETKLDFFGFIEKLISGSPSRANEATGKPLSIITIRIYKRSLALLREFSEVKRRKIDFTSIDLDFYQDYIAYLTEIKKFSSNTIGKHIKVLKFFLNEATERGLNTSLAYKSRRFKIVSEKTDSIYLTEKELEDIHTLELINYPRLEKVRDLFLVGCWTGLRFSDFSRIKPENIKDDFIEIETQKTGEKVTIPIHPTVREIMTRYKGKYPNSLPPAISNQKMNQFIKEFAKRVESLNVRASKTFTKGGVNMTTSNIKAEMITTHTARRSFASNLYIDGVPAITIMKITGHKTEKAFLLYIKITPTENAKILQLHWQKKKKLRVA
ncbi:MAG: Integrase family protein [Bacteroidetes bacterium]|nr:Integrase family protein [Bacteroidota bacterium]